MEFVDSSVVSLKSHPEFNERWLHEQIIRNPSILGLGDLIVRDSERVQPRAGRLDLLLYDPDSETRYTVEIQLGPTDESHIIRTIEYWDIEKRRFRNTDHVAVIVAEDITSRFLNVITILNGVVPLVAIQMQALGVGDQLTLHATKVVDVATITTPEEEELSMESVDRRFWENKGSEATLNLVDRFLGLIREVTGEHDLEWKYNKNYIGLWKSGVVDNFVTVRPKVKHAIFEFRIPRSEELSAFVEDSGLEVLAYSKQWGKFRVAVREDDLDAERDTITELVRRAWGVTDQVT